MGGIASWGITPGGDETPDGDLILAGALTVVPDKDGVLQLGTEVVTSADGRTDYYFRADRLALDSWAIDESTLRRVRDGAELPVDAVAMIVAVQKCGIR